MSTDDVPAPEPREATAAVAMTAAAAAQVGDGDVGAVNEGASILIKQNMWIDWSWIALNHLFIAEDARKRALILLAADGRWTQEMSNEIRASMVVISAAAHALDALYGGLKQAVSSVQAPGGGGNKSARHDHIRTAIASTYFVSNGVARQWNQDFTWLFGLRDSAAHPREAFNAPVSNPISGSNSQEAAAYCVENARRAVRLLRDVLDVMTDPTAARSGDARSYIGRAEPVLPALQAAVQGHH